MEKNTFKDQIMHASICVSDLNPEDLKQTSNGKKYLNITMSARKEVDQYGNNATVYLTQSKEERTEKKEKRYIGNAKHILFTGNAPENAPTAESFNNTPF